MAMLSGGCSSNWPLARMVRFGPRTEKAVRDYQTNNGLGADGMAGPVTLKHLFAKVRG